jgi:4a-hydroxytetrahydrobiopterin dehydratase
MSDLVCDLADKSCEPCRGGVPPLTADGIAPLAAQLDDAWSVVDHHHLHRQYDFPDWKQAQAFVNVIGDLAESEGHHPDLQLGWGKVVVELHTHKIDGLAEADFVLAAKIERAFEQR